MALTAKSNVVEKYVVKAILTQPMHIGSAGGNKGEILVHPVDDDPFIQASGLAGVMKSYCERVFGKDTATKFFGDMRSENDIESGESRIRITDGIFDTKKSGVKLELRPRVAINTASGSVDSSRIKGTNALGGNKFEMEYLGAGSVFSFTVYDMNLDHSLDEMGLSEGRKLMENLFCAMNQESIQIGGQKSNGCGYIKIEEVKYIRYDLTVKEQLDAWISETIESTERMETIKLGDKEKKSALAYRISVVGRTEGAILVRAIATENRNGRTMEAVNLQNSAKDYIVPASSFKGAARSHAERVLEILKNKEGIKVTGILLDSFGSDEKRDVKKLGNLRFFDAIIGDRESNDKVPSSHRIRIDKFTGGVMDKALITERNAGGKLTFRVNVLDTNNPDKSCALMLLVLRDLANGQWNVGSGYSIGKGIIDVETIEIKSTDAVATLDFKNSKVTDEKGIIKKCMEALLAKEAG